MPFYILLLFFFSIFAVLLLRLMEVFKKRDSNVELLRILSMLLVLVAHASYVLINPPTQEDISNSFGLSLFRSLSESFSEVCLDVFILISE